MNQKSRYIMIGGFLGAGKTTSIQAFAEHLDQQGLKVGLITNDQGAGLVDSALARSHRFPVQEISGGCFCCRFNSLMDAARQLTADTRPDIFLAEPVGSCTDLVATVSLPLQKIYGEDYQVAPLCVLVDPVRARRVLELEEGKRFSDNVRYIYLKQLEEAERIVINKTDLVDDAQLDELIQSLNTRFPNANVTTMSARNGDGLNDWFQTMLEGEMNVARFMEVDYDQYADGEALLGWLNCSVELEHPDGQDFDGNQLLLDLATTLRDNMNSEGIEIAHLKMTLNPLGDPLEVAAANLVRTDQDPELSHHLVDPIDSGQLLLNMRCEADPDLLDKATREAFTNIFAARYQLDFKETHREHFRPAPPQPTHRLTAPETA
ncbi:MAG: GTP-binding protein [Verrucomicrobiota bacterium]